MTLNGLPQSASEFHEKHNRWPKGDADWAEISEGCRQGGDEFITALIVISFVVALVANIVGRLLGWM